jgi:hypothetical protein
MHRWVGGNASMGTGLSSNGVNGQWIRRSGKRPSKAPLIYESTNPLLDYFTPKFSWINFHIAARMWAFSAGSTTPWRDFGYTCSWYGLFAFSNS